MSEVGQMIAGYLFHCSITPMARYFPLLDTGLGGSSPNRVPALGKSSVHLIIWCCLSSVLSGDRSANPAGVSGHCILRPET